MRIQTYSSNQKMKYAMEEIRLDDGLITAQSVDKSINTEDLKDFFTTNPLHLQVRPKPKKLLGKLSSASKKIFGSLNDQQTTTGSRSIVFKNRIPSPKSPNLSS